MGAQRLGRSYGDPRRRIEAILWILRAGMPRRVLSDAFVARQTVYSRAFAVGRATDCGSRFSRPQQAGGPAGGWRRRWGVVEPVSTPRFNWPAIPWDPSELDPYRSQRLRSRSVSASAADSSADGTVTASRASLLVSKPSAHRYSLRKTPRNFRGHEHSGSHRRMAHTVTYFPNRN